MIYIHCPPLWTATRPSIPKPMHAINGQPIGQITLSHPHLPYTFTFAGLLLVGILVRAPYLCFRTKSLDRTLIPDVFMTEFLPPLYNSSASRAVLLYPEPWMFGRLRLLFAHSSNIRWLPVYLCIFLPFFFSGHLTPPRTWILLLDFDSFMD